MNDGIDPEGPLLQLLKGQSSIITELKTLSSEIKALREWKEDALVCIQEFKDYKKDRHDLPDKIEGLTIDVKILQQKEELNEVSRRKVENHDRWLVRSGGIVIAGQFLLALIVLVAQFWDIIKSHI